jgi:Fe-S-cluster-containing hydrogenase component 2
MKLNIDLGNCVKVVSKNSSCQNCADVCPVEAINFIENIPQVLPECTDCGLCLGVCPTEAISLRDFDILEFVFGFLELEDSTIKCQDHVPCVGTLHVEHLISLALLKEQQLELECCELCYQESIKKTQEANFFLQSLQSDKQINVNLQKEQEKEVEQVDNRRDFLKRLSLKGAIKSKIEFEKEVQSTETKILNSNDSANIRKKELPNKRKLLYMALKRVGEIPTYELIQEQNLSFISQKSINSSCDNCSMCYRICPTGALQSDKRGSKIDFDALSCVKCRLCHDVCEPDAITLVSFNTKSMFEPKIDELIKFDVIRCNDCGNFFTYQGGEPTCYRCTLEEEEAKSLWGIQ